MGRRNRSRRRYHHVRVTNGGAGYTDGTHTGVSIVGDGSGAVCEVVVSSGAITHVNVTVLVQDTNVRQ